jgi:hypothetical protein
MKIWKIKKSLTKIKNIKGKSIFNKFLFYFNKDEYKFLF